MKKIFLGACIFFICVSSVQAGFNICYDGNGENPRKIGSSPKVGCLYFSDKDQAKYDSAKLLISSKPRKHLKVSGGVLVEKTQPEKDAIAASEAAAATAEETARIDAGYITVSELMDALEALGGGPFTRAQIIAQVKTDLGL